MRSICTSFTQQRRSWRIRPTARSMPGYDIPVVHHWRESCSLWLPGIALYDENDFHQRLVKGADNTQELPSERYTHAHGIEKHQSREWNRASRLTPRLLAHFLALAQIAYVSICHRMHSQRFLYTYTFTYSRHSEIAFRHIILLSERTSRAAGSEVGNIRRLHNAVGEA